MSNREHKTGALDNAHTMTAEEAVESLRANFAQGLTTAEAEERVRTYGQNTISEKPSVGAVIIFLSQFKGPFIILLAIAAGLSGWFAEWLDVIAIVVVILMNAIIGFIMEYRAERSMESLKKLTRLNAKVLRDGKVNEIPSENIVPGDILVAEAGDIILADARVCQFAQLETDESALTGESLSVTKDFEPLQPDTPLAERNNMLYKGTFITRGNVRAVVTATGMQTELGHIAAMVQSAEETVTPLEKKISYFSRRILWLTLGLVAVIFIVSIIKGEELIAVLQTSIALAVAAIPEGLPIVTTLALAQGMIRMARYNVIIKKLSAVETLGGTNTICTDKTGTLTQNRIEVNSIVIPGGDVEFHPHAESRSIKVARGDREILSSPNYSIIEQVSVLCSTAEITVDDKTIKESGDPLETGLLKFVYAAGGDIGSMRQQFPKVAEEPFSSETKMMVTVHTNGNGHFVAAKGAAEEMVRHCVFILENGTINELDDRKRDWWLERALDLAASGMRVIGVAFNDKQPPRDNLSAGLIFSGLIGLLDPPRDDVYDAIRECHSAGINVIMITGDHPATAKNIGMKLGLVENGNEEVIHGSDMPAYEDLDDNEKQRWMHTKIFARVSPKQKLDLVTVLQENNAIVGMTGDGVNDAPALKKADIGIAMGDRGTQVAQEAADVILKDDSFASIVIAIKSGRIIFENIRKFIIFLLSCNLSELLVISLAALLNQHYVLIPLQILYINLVTDVLPALALGFTKGSSSIMKLPPRNPSEQIIDRRRWISIFTYSGVIAACSFAAVWFAHTTLHNHAGADPQLCNNVLFITLILSQLWNVLNMTTDNNVPIFKTDVFRNKYVWFAIGTCLLITSGAYLAEPVARALGLYWPGLREVFVMFGFSVLSLLIIRVLKRTKIIL